MVRERVTAAPALGSWASVDEAAREMCEFQADMDALTAKRDAEVHVIRADYEARIRPLKEGLELRAKAIEEFCMAHQNDFDKQRSKRLTWITVSFRFSTRLATLAKMTWEKVLRVLKERGRSDLVRVREEVDKEAVRSAGLSESDLRALGMRVIVEDRFGYELNRLNEVAGGRDA